MTENETTKIKNFWDMDIIGNRRKIKVFQSFGFNAVYNSILFSFPSVLLSNPDFRGFRSPRFFMSPHASSITQGMPVCIFIAALLRSER